MDCLTTSFLEEEVTLADIWPDVKIEVQTLMSQFLFKMVSVSRRTIDIKLK